LYVSYSGTKTTMSYMSMSYVSFRTEMSYCKLQQQARFAGEIHGPVKGCD